MTGTPHPIRPLTLAIAAVMAVALVAPAPAHASRSRVEQLRAELNAINSEFRRAGAAYDKAFWALDETEAAIDKTSARIGESEIALRDAQDQLQDRIASWYRSDDFGLVGFLVAAEDFEDFITRMDFASRIAAADASAIDRVETLLAQLREDRARLEAEKQQRAEDLGRFKAERDALQRKLSSKRAEYDRVQRALAEAARREQASRQGLQVGAAVPMRSNASAVAGPNGMVFPVAGPHYYSDTWGASRDGGRRRHRGTDVMAPTGTPVVATLAGTVSRGDGARSGLMIRLVAANGWEFYYMHLDRILVGSGRVSAGQVIGTVGYTGNASASAPHLHFEIHIPGRGAVNPYSYLRQMQGR